MRITHRFSVAAYDRMIEDGFLTPRDRVELIRGELVPKMPIGAMHASVVTRLCMLFCRVFGERVIVSVQSPVVLEDSEPEPDLTLLIKRADYYASQKPESKHVLLLIEVSDSTVEFDRNTKLPLYAENGIPEYWIVNLEEECLEIYRSPQSDGTYRKKLVLHRGDKVSIAALKETNFEVADLF